MRVYQLLWFLFRHALKGRFRDEVFLCVDVENDRRELSVAGKITDFTVESRAEAFLIINAICEDDGPHVEEPPFIGDLIEASSLGTPEAKALRDSVPDEVVDRIMARYREIKDAPDVWINDPLPGGYVCGAPDPARPDGICGMPVEDEPCPTHQAPVRAG